MSGYFIVVDVRYGYFSLCQFMLIYLGEVNLVQIKSS
jgi:hypothetical protein